MYIRRFYQDSDKILNKLYNQQYFLNEDINKNGFSHIKGKVSNELLLKIEEVIFNFEKEIKWVSLSQNQPKVGTVVYPTKQATYNPAKTFANVDKKFNNGKRRLSFSSKDHIKHLFGDQIFDFFNTLLTTLNISNEHNLYRAVYEEIDPSDITHIGWHVDGNIPYLKVMLLLDKVDRDTAPMKILKASNKLKSYYELRKKLMIKGQINIFQDLDDNPSDYYLCTGSRGDLIIFDTRSLHSGSTSKELTRKSLTLSYIPTNQKAIKDYNNVAYDN